MGLQTNADRTWDGLASSGRSWAGRLSRPLSIGASITAITTSHPHAAMRHASRWQIYAPYLAAIAPILTSTRIFLADLITRFAKKFLCPRQKSQDKLRFYVRRELLLNWRDFKSRDYFLTSGNCHFLSSFPINNIRLYFIHSLRLF
jgi:hypothetical protein